jgi:hypothetical protein
MAVAPASKREDENDQEDDGEHADGSARAVPAEAYVTAYA